MINILVTGANGQLGNEIKANVNSDATKFAKPINFIFTDIDTLDITNQKKLSKYINDHQFEYIINCAAYTNVDLAEKETDKAFQLNADCIKYFIESAQELNSKFIHISTDYVFDGMSHKPYSEDMETNPQSVYGRSKLAGEKHALSYPNSMVIRTSWLYSSFGKNFAKTIHKFSKEKSELNVIFDQIGTPTYARDLADAVINIISQSINAGKFIPGIYHYSNEGVCSWYDFAKLIAQKSNPSCKINPIESKDYPTPVARPFYSVLNKSKIKKTYQIDIPHWQDSFNDFFKLI